MSIGKWRIRDSIRKKKSIIKPILTDSDSLSVSSVSAAPLETKINTTKQSQESKVSSFQKHLKDKSIAGLGISISNIGQLPEDESTNDTSASKDRNERSELFTHVQLINEWKGFAELLTEEHHLKNTMLNCLPELLTQAKFEVVVNNPVQEQRLLENMYSILAYLQDKLNNNSIEMIVRVTVENEKRLGFTSLEKYNLMTEQNEYLQKLKDEFGLELM